LGLIGIIGKDERGQAICDALVRTDSVYFCAVGGAGALGANHVTSAEEIAFLDLGCELVKRLTVDRLPVTVCIDANGGNNFKDERQKYRESDTPFA